MGPRGDRERRLQTVKQRLVAEMAIYRVSHTLHTPPTMDPWPDATAGRFVPAIDCARHPASAIRPFGYAVAVHPQEETPAEGEPRPGDDLGRASDVSAPRVDRATTAVDAPDVVSRHRPRDARSLLPADTVTDP